MANDDDDEGSGSISFQNYLTFTILKQIVFILLKNKKGEKKK